MQRYIDTPPRHFAACTPSPWTQGVELARGDTLLGDTLRSTLAEVTAQTMESGAALDLDFAVVNEKGEPPSVERLRQKLASL